MITLYHCADARSLRVLWTLEELGLPYDLRLLPFPPRVAARDYLAINPLGTVPLLLDGETRMTESAAICQFLAARHGPTPLAVAPDEPAYGAYLNWLSFGEATLTVPLTLVLRYGRLEPAARRLPQIVEDYGRWFLARLRAVEAALAAGPTDGADATLCAGRFTAADISVGYALLLAIQVGLGPRLPERVAAYWARLKQRDAYGRAIAAQGGETAGWTDAATA